MIVRMKAITRISTLVIQMDKILPQFFCNMIILFRRLFSSQENRLILVRLWSGFDGILASNWWIEQNDITYSEVLNDVRKTNRVKTHFRRC